DVAQKGMPIEEVAGEARILSVSGDQVTLDRALPAGQLAYLGDDDPGGALPGDGDPSPAVAGAPGFAFARVLVDPDGVRMAPHHRFLVGDREMDGCSYDGRVPGPTIRARRGDRLVVDFRSDLPVDTTIHWHGLHVPYAMDGVTWQHDPVGPGGYFRYEFTLD